MYLETIEDIPEGKQIFINYGQDDPSISHSLCSTDFQGLISPTVLRKV